MAVVIRLKRTGRRNRPCYRISVNDRARPRDSRTIESLGHYDPVSPVEGMRVALDVERAKFWLENGALPSETVRSIFRAQGVYGESMPVKKKRDRSGRKKKTATRVRRQTRRKTVAEAKQARREARAKARAEARATAAASESSEDGS